MMLFVRFAPRYYFRYTVADRLQDVRPSLIIDAGYVQVPYYAVSSISGYELLIILLNLAPRFLTLASSKKYNSIQIQPSQ